MPIFKTASRPIDRISEAKKEFDTKIAEMVRPKSGAKTFDAARAKTLFNENEVEIAQTVIQFIDESVTITDPLPFFADQVTGNLSDNYVFQNLDGTLRVVDRSYGTKPISQMLQFREFSMTTKHKEIAVEIPLELVAIGRITPSQVTESIAAAIQRDRVSAFLAALSAAVASGTDNTEVTGYNKRYTGFTQANLDKAIDGLLDDAENPTLFARAISVIPAIRGYAGYTDSRTGWSPDTLREFEQRGYVGQYHGCNIVVLRDQSAPMYFRQEGTGHLIPSNRWWMSSGVKGARYMAKDVSFLNWSYLDQRTSSFGVGIRLEEGLMVYNDNRYRVIDQ